MSGEMDEIDLDRLVKLRGMLGSDHFGERAAAAAKAAKLVRSANVTWKDLLRLRHSPPSRRSRYQPEEHADDAKACLDSGVQVSEWEARFLESIQSFDTLSDKQREVLERLCRKCGVRWWP
jgi:hypothetical protein